MSGAIFGLELRRSRALVGWLALVLVIYGAVMAVMYPILKENSKLLEDYLKIMPQAFLQAFGMEGSLTDPGVFFTTYISSWLWPIMAGLGGILIATRPVAADADRRFVEMPLATQVSRTRYLLLAIAGQLVALAVLAVAAVIGLLVVGNLVGAEFDALRFAMGGAAAFLFAAAVVGPTTLLSVVTLNRGLTGAVVAGLLVGMYLLDVISKIQPDLEWIGQLSLMHYFRTTPIVDTGTWPLADAAVLIAVAVLGWGGAVWLFRGRDLAA